MLNVQQRMENDALIPSQGLISSVSSPNQHQRGRPLRMQKSWIPGTRTASLPPYAVCKKRRKAGISNDHLLIPTLNSMDYTISKKEQERYFQR